LNLSPCPEKFCLIAYDESIVYLFGFCPQHCSAGSVSADRLQMVLFQYAELQKGVLFDLHLPAPVGFAIMRSHEVHGRE